MRRPEAGIIALAILASACAVPTESPNWDVTWNVPVPDNGKLNIGVSSFLPSGVTTFGSPPTAFSATIASPPAISRTLGADCGSCAALNGTNAPKPAFNAAPPATTVSLQAAANLTSATLATGSQVVFSINNGFNFDPIRPQAGSATVNTGSLTLTVSNGPPTAGSTLGTLTVLGTASAIPAGQTTSFTLPLAGTINGNQPLTVTFTLNSPAGSNVTINTAQIFSVSAVPTVRISSATVNIGAQNVSSVADSIDLSGIDSAIVLRIKDTTANQGTMFLTITNPLTLGGSMTLNFSAAPLTTPFTPIVKNVTLPPATNASTAITTTIPISFTGHELRTILGRKLLVNFGGQTAAGSLTVTPSQVITASVRLQLTAFIKEQ